MVDHLAVLKRFVGKTDTPSTIENNPTVEDEVDRKKSSLIRRNELICLSYLTLAYFIPVISAMTVTYKGLLRRIQDGFNELDGNYIELAVLYYLFFIVFIKHTSVAYVVLMLMVIHTTYTFYHTRLRKYPPGPVPLPILGNTLEIDTRHPAKTLSKWQANFGPVFTVWLPHPMVVIADHDVLKEALITKGHYFTGRPVGYIWSMFTHNDKHGDGIILCEGERWEQLREFSHKIFRSTMGESLMEQKILTHAHNMVNYIDRLMGDQREITMDIESVISQVVGNIIQDFVLGDSYPFGDERFEKFKKLIDAVLADVASKPVQLVNAYPILSILPIPAIKRYRKNGYALQRYFLHAIHEHSQNMTFDGEPKDFIEAYLREMKTTQKDNPHYNELTLALAAGDLWTGGMETTVTTLRWAILYMLYSPHVQEKCYSQIEQVFGTEEPSYSAHKQLPYVEATLAETLRVANVLPWAIPHRTTADVKVRNHFFPAGTVVLPQFGTVQFDPRHFPEPEAFIPDRFINNGVFVKRPELNPFGMGKRSCLGEKLARYELFLILTTLLQNYEFLKEDREQLPSRDRSEGMTNVPKRYKVVVRKRAHKI